MVNYSVNTVSIEKLLYRDW